MIFSLYWPLPSIWEFYITKCWNVNPTYCYKSTYLLVSPALTNDIPYNLTFICGLQSVSMFTMVKFKFNFLKVLYCQDVGATITRKRHSKVCEEYMSSILCLRPAHGGWRIPFSYIQYMTYVDFCPIFRIQSCRKSICSPDLVRQGWFELLLFC